MGADIHFVLERRTPHGWCGVYSTGAPLPPARNREDYSKLNRFHHPLLSDRNYTFFAALAGVRGDGPEPNGIPPDVSLLASEAIDAWDSDGHSHSHCTALEFVRIWDLTANNGKLALEATTNKLLDNKRPLDDLLDLIGLEQSTYEQSEWRVIYWFDN